MPGVTTAFQTGIHSARPAANAGCIHYSCTTHSLIYQSDGTTWTTWASLVGTGLADPMTTRGDIIVRDASNVTARLAIGSTGKVLSSDGTDISWQTPSATGIATDTLWDAAGDLVQGSGANTGAKLSAGTAGKVLTSNGAAAALTWETPSAGGVTRAYLGTNAVGGTQETATTNRLYAQKVTPASTCVLQNIEIYTREASDNLGGLIVALYEDNAGALGKLLAANTTLASMLAFTNNATFGDGSTTSIARWFGVPLTAQLTGSTSYWLGWFWIPGTTSPRQFYDGSGTDRRYDSGGTFLADGGRYSETTDSRKYSVRALTIA